MEDFFTPFRENIIGHPALLYADWTASGRAYKPIEAYMQKEILPYTGNTHTLTTTTGSCMSGAYATAKKIIKQHVGASEDDVLLFCGSGMTAAVNKLQRILGLRIPERLLDYTKEAIIEIDEVVRPVVFITHMEHHSNQVSWLETIATVELFSDLHQFQILLERYKHCKNKIASITACSNVTGIQTPYHEIAKMIHAAGGLCLVDFACSAPYVAIDMHPPEAGAHLDAIFFSPHKFLGGPGTPGVLIFNEKMYTNKIPDQPGGGTVMYSNPWGVHAYVEDIEEREDGGTPPFLQAIKAGMCIKLKEAMGVENILQQEKELLAIVFDRFSKIKNIEVLEGNIKDRLGIVSFIVNDAHYNGFVKILNDRFGIQARGGCSCAGTYGHRLLNVDQKRSYAILDRIREGDLSCKPGWIRLSIHPTMTPEEIHFIMDAIEQTVCCFNVWIKAYSYDTTKNEYILTDKRPPEQEITRDWFEVTSWGL